MAELAPSSRPGSTSDALADLHLRRDRLIGLFAEGDIDRATSRSRQGKLEAQIRAAEAERAAGAVAMPAIPSTLNDLVATWDESAIDFQRQLIEILIDSITVRPAASRRRKFDPTRLDLALRA